MYVKIINHGELHVFTCKECGCMWKASKKECTTYTIDGHFKPKYQCDCPDCGNKNVDETNYELNEYEERD